MFAGPFFGDYLGAWLGGGESPVIATTEIDVDRWLLLPAESRVLELVGESRVLILEE